MSAFVQVVKILSWALPWILEAAAYSLFCPLFIPFFGNWCSLIFLTQFVVGSYADRNLWAKRETSRPQPRLAAAIVPILVAVAATMIFGTSLTLLMLLRVTFFAVIVAFTKYLVWEWLNLKAD